MSEEVVCRPYDIRYEDHLPNGDPGTNIRMWCLDRQSNPVLIRIENFLTFIRVELPRVVEGRKFHWDQDKINIFEDWLSACLQRENHGPKFSKVGNWFPLYYYQEKSQKFLVLFFDSLTSQSHCCNLLNRERKIDKLSNSKMMFKVWEKDITPVRKLLTVKDMKHTQWFRFQGDNIHPDSKERISKPGHPSRPQREYLVDWKIIQTISAEESKEWMVDPKILSYDFETHSHIHRAFPSPYHTKDVIFNISCIGQYQNQQTNFTYLYGRAKAPANTIYEQVDSELELIEKFEDLIDEYDPEILTGYNIFGFDNAYFHCRKKIKGEKIKNFTRLKNGEVKIQVKKWKSAGCGHVIMSIIDAEGRISIDMLPVIKRDHKLRVYNLNFVSKHFLGEGKHDVKAITMFRLFEKNQKLLKDVKNSSLEEALENPNHIRNYSKMSKVLEYSIQDSMLNLKLFKTLNIWISILEMSWVVGVPIVELFTAGQQIRTYSLLFDLAWKRGFVLNKRSNFPIIPYSGAYVGDPEPGIYNNGICLDFKSLYPNIIIANNLCYSTLRNPQETQIMLEEGPDLTKHRLIVCREPEDANNNDKDGNEDENEDGNDLNFVFNEKIRDEDLDRNDDEEDENQDENEEEKPEKLEEKRFIEYKFLWVREEIRRGLMPQLMEDLINERGQVRQQIKNVEKEIKQTSEPEKITNLLSQIVVLDKRQLALKITANSGYGFLGAQTAGISPLVEAAMCVTHIGKESILKANRYLEEKYNAKIIYNDTDSTLFTIPGVGGAECNDLGKKLAQEVSGLFPRPMELDFEKAMKMIIFKKKKYAYYLLKKDGSFLTENDVFKNGVMLYLLNVKGIISARRDNCSWLLDCYNELLRYCLEGGQIVGGFQIIIKHILMLMEGHVDPVKQLSVVKTVNANYVSNSCQMKIFKDRLEAIGKPVNPGERLTYLVIKDEREETETLKVGEKMILVEDFDPKIHQVDLVYYLDKLLKAPIDQLFSVAFKDELPKYKEFSFTPENSRKKPKDISTPVQMISLIIQDIYKKKKNFKSTIKTIASLDQQFQDFINSV